MFLFQLLMYKCYIWQLAKIIIINFFFFTFISSNRMCMAFIMLVWVNYTLVKLMIIWWSNFHLVDCSLNKTSLFVTNSTSVLLWRNWVPCGWEWWLCRSPGLENRKWPFQNRNCHSTVSKNWACFSRRYVSDRLRLSVLSITCADAFIYNYCKHAQLI